MACIEGHTQIVELLLKHGADINVTDTNGVRSISNCFVTDRNYNIFINCNNNKTNKRQAHRN